MTTILSDIEVRVLGSLVEKQVTTPEYYPLTLNSLTLACNQKNNRSPVTSYSEDEVAQALETLREIGIVRRKRIVDAGSCRVRIKTLGECAVCNRRRIVGD